jgi:hypothetical protein
MREMAPYSRLLFLSRVGWLRAEDAPPSAAAVAADGVLLRIVLRAMVYLVYKLELRPRVSIRRIAAGPANTTKMAGKINSTSGAMSLTVVFWAASSAAWRRLTRMVSD